MNNETCLIGGCTEPLYAPAGTRSVCKDHFLQFLAWRKKKGGLSMFKRYSAQPMEERDSTVEEWENSVLGSPAS